MKRVCSLLLATIFAVVFAVCVGLGTEVNFDPSTYNPMLGESVSFEAYRPEWGTSSLRYEWDFDGNGTVDVTTDEACVTYVFGAPGFIAVTLTVTDVGGRAETRSKGLLVGASPVHAVRDLFSETGGSVFVRITLVAQSAVSAPGLEETLPSNCQVEILDSGGGYVKRTGRTLQVLWMEAIGPEETRTLSFRLYPTYGTGVPALSGTLSAYAEGRVAVPVCGDLAVIR
jgi:hypothetical protein